MIAIEPPPHRLPSSTKEQTLPHLTGNILKGTNPADLPVWRRAKFDDMFDDTIESLLKYSPR
jgi:hypothetical protein